MRGAILLVKEARIAVEAARRAAPPKAPPPAPEENTLAREEKSLTTDA